MNMRVLNLRLKRSVNAIRSYNFYNQLVDISFFLRQVPMHLPGGVKYVCDYLIFWSDGNVSFEDVKGYRTDLYKAKKKIVEAKYPIKIEEV